MLEEGIARSVEDANVVAVVASGQPQKPRINEGLRNELKTHLIQMRASGQHAQEELAELRQEFYMTQNNLQQNIVVMTDQIAVEMLQRELSQSRAEGQYLKGAKRSVSETGAGKKVLGLSILCTN
eukprot:4167722-Amphidinium_carterae.2